ncbi:ABC transporter substrate-binding protein [Rhodococcus sp. IEGM 1330]|uniref:ABC transporter substrate-binding protein n=1 Tax=Rhodococcus sp. IEGM 1330 TaxID=3082225 RepID=UPI002953B98D|nr:ABC transporter substrate-binding protein [Rhodococcus sp. IEGM 1330]MDV8021337.1 ABC transporter substrate-binding protein [Rhodococcus sp. IEGM 1330]
MSPGIMSSLALDRRGFFLVAGAVALATACSPRAQDAAAATSQTVRMTGDGFDVTVPTRPTRVVVMEGRGDLEFALLAGYPIIATGNTFQPGARPSGQFEGLLDAQTEVIGGPDGPAAEEIAALSPDLIVMRANGWRLDWYGNEQLTKIAPVLPVEVNEPNFEQYTVDQFSAIGLLDTVQPGLDEYQRTIDDAATVTNGRRIALITSEPVAKGYVIVWTNYLGNAVAADMGFTVLHNNPEDEEGNYRLSVENLNQIADAEFIFHQTTDPTQIDGIAAWQNLPAVAAGRSAVLDPQLNNGLVITATSFANRLIEVVRSAG